MAAKNKLAFIISSDFPDVPVHAVAKIVAGRKWQANQPYALFDTAFHSIPNECLFNFEMRKLEVGRCKQNSLPLKIAVTWTAGGRIAFR
jgi:hypothetical protein